MKNMDLYKNQVITMNKLSHVSGGGKNMDQAGRIFGHIVGVGIGTFKNIGGVGKVVGKFKK